MAELGPKTFAMHVLLIRRVYLSQNSSQLSRPMYSAAVVYSHRVTLQDLPEAPIRNKIRLGAKSAFQIYTDVTCTFPCLATTRETSRHYEKVFWPDTFRLLATLFAFVALISLSSSSSSSFELIAFLLRLRSAGPRSSMSRCLSRFGR